MSRLDPILRRVGRGRAERRRLEARVRKLERTLAKPRGDEMQTVRLEYPGAELVIDARTKLARKRRTAARKEPFTVEWIESLPPGDVLYDIGANVGGYSLIAARRPQGPLRVVAFEPGYASFATLCTNLVLNEIDGDEVMPLPVTLGDETRLGTFRYSDVAAGAALHAGAIDDERDAAFAQPVLVHRLDDLVATFGLPAPNHLKVDVDGAELHVLRGAARTLADPGVRSVMIELSRGEDDAAEELLVAAGLRRARTYKESGGARFWYALYERPSP